jgi:hypothetical protein
VLATTHKLVSQTTKTEMIVIITLIRTTFFQRIFMTD